MQRHSILTSALVSTALLAACSGGVDITDGRSDTVRTSSMRLDPPIGGPYWEAHPAFGFPTYGVADPQSLGLPAAWEPTEHKGLPESFGTGSLQHLARVNDIDTGEDGIPEGAGISVFGHHAYVGGGTVEDGPISVVDIQDPQNPQVVASIDAPHRDGETIAYPDGRLILLTTGGGQSIYLTDITDPANPELFHQFEAMHTSHNVAVLPGTPLFYNSPGGGSATDIWDLSDPENPVLVQDWQNGTGCHDIMWYIDNKEQKYRGYCAGVPVTQIWDITDPFDPQVISETPIPESTPLSFSHLAMVNHDASVMIVGDETGGGLAPACDYSLANPVTGETMSGPSGNLWFYDISDETNPVFKSRLSVNAFDSHANCTSHFGRVVEDTNHLVIAFYGAGVTLINFVDVANPRVVDKWRPVSADPAVPGSTWDAWYYQGYVVTGDLLRGMDLLAIGEPLL